MRGMDILKMLLIFFTVESVSTILLLLWFVNVNFYIQYIKKLILELFMQ